MQYPLARWTALGLMLAGLVTVAACIEDSDSDDDRTGEVRVVHAISDVRSVDVAVDGQALQPLRQIAYGDSSGLISLDAGEVEITVGPSGGGDEGTLDLEGLEQPVEIVEDERHVLVLSHREEAGPYAQFLTEEIPEEAGQETGTVHYRVGHYSPIAPEELDFYIIEDGESLDDSTEPVATVAYDGLGEAGWSEAQEFQQDDFNLIVTEAGADPTDPEQQLFRHQFDQSEAGLLEGELVLFAAMDTRRSTSPIDVTVVREAAGEPFLGLLDERSGLRVLHGFLDEDDPDGDGAIDIDLDDAPGLITGLAPGETSATRPVEHGERVLDALYSSDGGHVLSDEELELLESEDVLVIVAGNASSGTTELIRRGMPFSPLAGDQGRFHFTHAAPAYDMSQDSDLELHFADDEEVIADELEPGDGAIFNIVAGEFEAEVRNEGDDLLASREIEIHAGVLYNVTAVDGEDGGIELIVDELPVNPALD